MPRKNLVYGNVTKQKVARYENEKPIFELCNAYMKDLYDNNNNSNKIHSRGRATVTTARLEADVITNYKSTQIKNRAKVD